MKASIKFEITELKSVRELPGYWDASRLLKVLETLEFDDASSVTADQLREYSVMALQDLELPEAAQAVLTVVCGDSLSEGKKQNISEDIEAERLWEEYPDLARHEDLFNVQSLLYEAFSQIQEPEARLLSLTLRGGNPAGEAFLKTFSAIPVPETLIVRGLALASEETSILNRLFEDQIAGGAFPEAAHLIWQLEHQTGSSETANKPVIQASFYSPLRWTESLRRGSSSILEIEE